MLKLFFKITAIFLVCFFITAAFHEAVPGLCLSRNPNGDNACPFCKLIYSLVILAVVICLATIHVLLRSPEQLAARIPCATRRTCWLLRGPPAHHA